MKTEVNFTFRSTKPFVMPTIETGVAFYINYEFGDRSDTVRKLMAIIDFVATLQYDQNVAKAIKSNIQEQVEQLYKEREDGVITVQWRGRHQEKFLAKVSQIIAVVREGA